MARERISFSYNSNRAFIPRPIVPVGKLLLSRSAASGVYESGECERWRRDSKGDPTRRVCEERSVNALIDQEWFLTLSFHGAYEDFSSYMLIWTERLIYFSSLRKLRGWSAVYSPLIHPTQNSTKCIQKARQYMLKNRSLSLQILPKAIQSFTPTL